MAYIESSRATQRDPVSRRKKKRAESHRLYDMPDFISKLAGSDQKHGIQSHCLSSLDYWFTLGATFFTEDAWLWGGKVSLGQRGAGAGVFLASAQQIPFREARGHWAKKRCPCL